MAEMSSETALPQAVEELKREALARSSWRIVCQRGSGERCSDVLPAIASWCDGCVNSAVLRALEGRAQAPAPDYAGIVCINCGVAGQGGYEVEDGPGPFCAECWSLIERHFALPAPPSTGDPRP